LRVVFLGSDPIALPLLEWLAGEGRGLAEVVAIFTQPDRPAGRGQKVQVGPIKAWGAARLLPIHQPEKLTEADRTALELLRPDLSLVMAYGQILRDPFIATPRLGTLNLHASVLPAWRGASPIQAAIASGARATGVSLMRIVRQLDAGPVADVESVPIAPLDTAAEIAAKLGAACVPLLARSLPLLAGGQLEFTEQAADQATYCRRLTKDDGGLDFAVPAETLAARINALTPWPGCSAEIGGQPVKLSRAEAQPERTEAPPGEVLGADADGLLIATGAGVLRVRRLQRPGGRQLAAGEFLRGRPVPPGTRLPSRPMPAFSAPRPFR
jgi:methionyl-tRNA formyltransferase